MTWQEAVDFYLQKKASGEMSLADIRADLNAKGEFSNEDINDLCAEISDRDLNRVKPKKEFDLAFLDNIYFSIFMILGSTAIFIYSLMRFLKIKNLDDLGADVEDMHYFIPAFFMLASLIYLFRHVIKIVARTKSTK